MIDNDLTAQRQTAIYDAFEKHVAYLTGRLSDFKDLHVLHDEYCLDNQFGIKVICIGERDLLSTPIFDEVIDFAKTYHYSFFVDVDKNDLPRIRLYINKNSVE